MGLGVNAVLSDPNVSKAIGAFSNQLQDVITKKIGISEPINTNITKDNISTAINGFIKAGGTIDFLGYSGASTFVKEGNQITKVTYTYIIRVNLPKIDYRGLRLTGSIDITFEDKLDVTPKPATPEVPQTAPTYLTTPQK